MGDPPADPRARYTGGVLSEADAALLTRDSGLPGLALLLDPEALLARLDGTALQADAALPLTLRYTPARAAVAAYRLRRDGEETLAYARAWGGQTPGTDRLPRRGSGAVVFEDAQLLVCGAANDLRLPALGRLLAPGTRGELLRNAGVELGSLAARSLEVLAYRPERRCAARVGEASRSVVLKLYREAGFRAAAARRDWLATQVDLPTCASIGSAEADRAIALRWLPGETLAAQLRRGDATPAHVAAAGQALAALHDRDASGLPAAPANIPLTRATAAAVSLDTLGPPLGEAARRILATLAPRLTDGDACVALHGDFHAKQVLIADAGAALLDLDDAAPGPPERDLGCFNAHLARDEVMRRIAPGAADAFEALFRDAYAARRPAPSIERIRAHAAAALLAMAAYPFRVRDPEWPTLVRALVTRAAAFAS